MNYHYILNNDRSLIADSEVKWCRIFVYDMSSWSSLTWLRFITISSSIRIFYTKLINLKVTAGISQTYTSVSSSQLANFYCWTPKRLLLRRLRTNFDALDATVPVMLSDRSSVILKKKTEATYMNHRDMLQNVNREFWYSDLGLFLSRH